MSRPYTDTLALPDAAMSSQQAPLAIVATMDTPPLCLRSLLEPAKVRGSIVEAQFACPPIEKLTVQVS